jgi:hypothetical protein
VPIPGYYALSKPSCLTSLVLTSTPEDKHPQSACQDSGKAA